jgi:hypothetical protein
VPPPPPAPVPPPPVDPAPVVTTTPQCVDGRDNDGDGVADGSDPGCASVTDNDESEPTVLASSASAGTLPLLTPFPVIRMSGRILASGVRVELLSVKAPSGSKITILCKGPRKSCPRSRTTTTTSGSTRIRSFERRLRSGTVLRIFVTKPGFVGKYTRFTIRRRKAPLRADACSRPNNTSLTCP